jgi:hypothetical protein
VIVDYTNGFKASNTMINHINGIIGNRDREASKSNQMGSVNHMTRAKDLNEEKDREDE